MVIKEDRGACCVNKYIVRDKVKWKEKIQVAYLTC